MATNRNDIGTKFETGDVPSQADFKQIFDSFVHKDEDKATAAMVDAGIDDEHYVTPALLRVGLQNIGAISGGGNLPYKQHIDNFDGSYILLEQLPIEASVKVFKNGQLLLEGADGDYTINYDTATVLFFNTVEGRNIEVDYWYKNLDPTPNTDGNYVDLTTDQTIAGQKTFNQVVINPLDSTASPFYYEDFATGFGDFVNSPNGDASWVWVTDDGADGSTTCISSGAIGNLSNSVIELTKTTTQESTLLKYWYKTSSEADYDYLYIEVNGVIVKRYSGINDWNEDHVFIHGVGSQIIKFIYNKDTHTISGQDKVWIDKVSLTDVNEDFIVNSDALFSNNATFTDGLIGKGLSSFEDLDIRRDFSLFNNIGNRTVYFTSQGQNEGAILLFYNSLPGAQAVISASKFQSIFQLNNFSNGVESFKVLNDVTYPGGLLVMQNSGARAIIGSHAGNYTDFTFAVNGNSKLDGNLDTTNTITANQFVKRDGTASQFLKADGSVDTNIYPLDSGVVHKTGNETITGQKTFDKVVFNSNSYTAVPFYYEDFATGFGDFVNSPNGDAPWVWVTDDGADGSTTCISSGAIGNYSDSVIELTKTTTQESTLLKYWYKASSEADYDYLHVEVNGVIVKRYSGTTDWTEDYLYVHGLGSQLIRFIYNKDHGAIGGQDKVWIDKVALINIEEDFIVNTEAHFTKKTNFKEGLTVTGFSSFKDVNVKGGFKVFDKKGNQTSGIGSYEGGAVLTMLTSKWTNPTIWMQTHDNHTQFYINSINNYEFFNAFSNANFPDGIVQINNSGARVIIGSHAYNYTDFTFAVNGNSKLDGNLDTTNTITANQFVKLDGTASQFLKADGSVDANIYPLDSGVVHKTGNETITGNKVFSDVTDFIGVVIDNGGSNRGLQVINNGAVEGVFIRSTDSGDSLIINDSVTATGTPFKIQKDDVTKFSVDGNGQATATSFVKSGGTANDILLADGTTTPLDGLGGEISPLVKIDEGNGNGYRLSNANSLNFGNIGADAIDFSYSDSPSDVFGATGSSAFAMGENVIASNYNSTAFGYLIDNNGIGSFDVGFNLKDRGYLNTLFGVGHDVTSIGTTVVGQGANIITDQIADFNYTNNKKLFVVGNGSIQNADDNYTVNTRSDALVVRLNGSVEAPSLTTALISADTTGKSLVTKEYLALNNVVPLQKEVTTTSYTIMPADLNYTIFFNNATAVTVTLNAGLPNNFECDFYNLGAGTVTFVSGTATLSIPDGASLAKDKVATLIRVMNTANYKLKGELV